MGAVEDPRWAVVDSYLGEHVVGTDPVLDAALASIPANGLPEIQVTAAQAKLLALLIRIQGARRVLEIGTLAGFSAIVMARALPADGKLVTLEYEAKHATIARENIARAGLAERVEVRVGAALDTLQQLVAERTAPFDFVFIDADKQNNRAYLDLSLQLTRKGAVIVVDNVVREGKVVDAGSTDGSVQGTRRLFDRLHQLTAEKKVDSTAIQTVGGKGYDGFALIVVD